MIKHEISKAISAHSMWKQTLRSAIKTGQCPSTPEKVRCDNNCSFGKWLLTRVDDSVRNTPLYPEIVEIHAKFHIEASQILALGLNREVEKAEERMKIGSEFSKLSAKLVSQLSEWQKTF